MADGDWDARAFDPAAPDDESRVATWTSPRSRITYALWWRVEVRNVPLRGGAEPATLRFEAWPLREDQELSTVPPVFPIAFPFWEGVNEPRNAELEYADGRKEALAPGELALFAEHVTYG